MRHLVSANNLGGFNEQITFMDCGRAGFGRSGRNHRASCLGIEFRMAEGRTVTDSSKVAVMERPAQKSETDLPLKAMVGKKSRLKLALSLLAVVLVALGIWHRFTPAKIGGKRLGQEVTPVGAAKVTKAISARCFPDWEP